MSPYNVPEGPSAANKGVPLLPSNGNPCHPLQHKYLLLIKLSFILNVISTDEQDFNC